MRNTLDLLLISLFVFLIESNNPRTTATQKLRQRRTTSLRCWVVFRVDASTINDVVQVYSRAAFFVRHRPWTKTRKTCACKVGGQGGLGQQFVFETDTGFDDLRPLTAINQLSVAPVVPRHSMAHCYCSLLWKTFNGTAPSWRSIHVTFDLWIMAVAVSLCFMQLLVT